MKRKSGNTIVIFFKKTPNKWSVAVYKRQVYCFIGLGFQY